VLVGQELFRFLYGSQTFISVCLEEPFVFSLILRQSSPTLNNKIHFKIIFLYSGVPRNFFRGGGGSTNSVEDRGQGEPGSGGGSPLVRGSVGSCNLVQEISFHIVKLS
jgi:hypothetical protein